MCDQSVGIGWELRDWDYGTSAVIVVMEGEKLEAVDLVEVLRLFAWLLY